MVASFVYLFISQILYVHPTPLASKDPAATPRLPVPECVKDTFQSESGLTTPARKVLRRFQKHRSQKVGNI